DADCAVSLKRIEHEHPYRARRVLEDGTFVNFITDLDVESFHSRQDLPPLYCTSGGLYTRRRHLLENYSGRDFALGQRRGAVLVDEVEAMNIDRLIDLQLAQFLVDQGLASDSL